MATFALGSNSREVLEANARRLERPSRDTSTSTATDLRGIPAIGRGVVGALSGSRPEHALIAKQP